MKSTGHNKLIVFIVSAFLVSISFLAWHINGLINSPLIVETDPAKIIRLDKSASAYQFANLLKQDKLIPSAKLLVSIIRLQGYAHQLKAGVYQIKPGESAIQLLNRVVAGDVITQKFTIIAGTTQHKVADDLSKAAYMDYKPTDWTTVQGDHQNAEGLLLAETYQYRGGSSSNTLLNQANRNLLDYLNTSWVNRDANLPYQTPYELLTAASIIEKETAIPAERKLISGVMVNRLMKKMPLQMDPTVIYALNSNYRGKLSHHDMSFDSPYNSYLYRGLPPTPIAMVGKEAIDAAAHPQRTAYFYFVAKGDGSHQFSETYEQQRQAIKRFQHKDI